MRRVLAAAVAVCCLVVVSCGRDDRPDRAAQAKASPKATPRATGGSTVDGSSVPSGQAAPGAGPGSSTAAPGGAAPTAKPGSTPTPNPSKPPKVTASPACVHRGETEKVTIQTFAFAQVSYAVSFSDGNGHGLYGVGRADAKGTYVWTFTVPLNAAYGKANVIVAASSEQGGGGARTSFEVKNGPC